jgi:D-alanine-D-alanine ligase
MKVCIIFDDVDARPGAAADECGVLEAVDAVEYALRIRGHGVVRAPLSGDPHTWLELIRASAPDLVFNLCEGVNGSSALEAHVAFLVELARLPATGSPADTLALARRKDRVNAILAAAGVLVPAWCIAEGSEMLPEWRRFPAIVKPAAEDASVGITQRSVVSNRSELKNAIAAGVRYGRLLVQDYIAGRELNVGIVGDEVLPIAEIDFGAMPAGAWPIVSYAAKWDAGSTEDRGTVPVCPARLEPEDAERIARIARAAWRAVGGSGYGRVDLRLAADGTPYVLEVNPNPDLAPAAGLTRMAIAHGWSYDELIARITASALHRHPDEISAGAPLGFAFASRPRSVAH